MHKKDSKVFRQKQNLDLNIDNYSGSYEKLLDLVQEKKIDLLNINLLEIIEQFIEFVNELSAKDLDGASEYLAMSAYLLQVKSKYLIPKRKVGARGPWNRIIRKGTFQKNHDYENISWDYWYIQSFREGKSQAYRQTSERFLWYFRFHFLKTVDCKQ